MSIRRYLEAAPYYDIVKYSAKESSHSDCIMFVGSPRKHPYDKEKILLVMDPFSANTVFYEFRLEDVVDAEQESSVGTDFGENLPMVKIWVTKGSLGVKYEPFEVDEPLRFLKDSELLHQKG